MRWRRLARWAGAAAAVPVLAAAVFVASPLPPGLTDYRPVSSLKVLDRDGGLLRELRSRADGRSTPLPASELSAPVRAAFLAAEDHRFFGHVGVSPTAIVRAAWQDLRAGRIVAGGSTITQQLARTLVPRPRTVAGKVQEVLWALRLEAHLSKEEILTQYLNRVPFGNNAFGLEAAAQLYFGTRAVHLSLGQAATLAAIPRGPTAYDPFRRQARLAGRRAWVLERLARTGLAAPLDVERARAEPVDLAAFTTAFRAPHFVEFLAAHLAAWGLERATVVQTSLDPALQTQAEQLAKEELARLADRRVGNAAALVLDNGSGEVLAYLGSADFFDVPAGGQNDGVQMRRQPGSALKPFVYAEAFRRGLTPATVVADLPAAFGSAKGTYSPKNYDRRLHGPVRVREALANSYNVPAVRVAAQLGTVAVLDVLHRAGFESLREGAEHYGLGLALGNGEVSPWELARAYAGLSRGGVLTPLRPILRAWGPDGEALPLQDDGVAQRFADAQAVSLVTHILSDPSARARAFGLDNALRLPFPAAAKTGTSKGYSDNWAAGYTRERTVVAWAGNFDGTPMVQVSGITGAGPLFKRLLGRAMEQRPGAPLVEPSGLERARICPLSGQRAAHHCPSAMEEVFLPGTAPRDTCAMHGALEEELPEDVQRRCLALAAEEGVLVDLGLDFYDWARNEGLSREPWLAATCLGQAGGEGPDTARILHPAEGDEFMLLPDLPLADQAIPLRVRAPAGQGPLDVRVDGAVVTRLSAPWTGRLPATRGAHELTLLDARGTVLARVRYTVRVEAPLR